MRNKAVHIAGYPRVDEMDGILEKDAEAQGARPEMLSPDVPGWAPGAGQISAAICRIEMTTLRGSEAGE